MPILVVATAALAADLGGGSEEEDDEEEEEYGMAPDSAPPKNADDDDEHRGAEAEADEEEEADEEAGDIGAAAVHDGVLLLLNDDDDLRYDGEHRADRDWRCWGGVASIMPIELSNIDVPPTSNRRMAKDGKTRTAAGLEVVQLYDRKGGFDRRCSRPFYYFFDLSPRII